MRMTGLRRPVLGVLLTVVTWTALSCCGYAQTPGPKPARGCPAGKLLLEDDPQQIALPVPGSARTHRGYEREINRIESASGAFAYDLVPELVGLGMLEAEKGDNADSIKTFMRALYIVRMHKGLYSPVQIPLLDMIIRCNSNMGHWHDVADAYDHLYWLYRRSYGDDDPRLLPFIRRLRQWHIDAYNKDTGRTLEQHLRAARALYDKGLSLLKACGEDGKPAACFWNRDCCSVSGTGKDTCPADKS